MKVITVIIIFKQNWNMVDYPNNSEENGDTVVEPVSFSPEVMLEAPTPIFIQPKPYL